MSNSEGFIIITNRDLPNKTDHIPMSAGTMAKVTSEIESDCACPVDDMILASDLQELGKPNMLEDDCACPGDGLTIENQFTYFNENARYIMPPLYTALVTGEYSLAFNSLGQSGVVVLNQPAMALLRDFMSSKTLAQGAGSTGDPAGALIAAHRLATLNLLQSVGSSMELKRSIPKTLTAWLHLTNECNLRCDYCYLHKTHDHMSLERGQQSVDAVFRSAIAQSFSQVKLKYAGGESTLEFGLILKLHDYALEQANRLKLGLIGVVLSNGIGISDHMIESLHQRNIRLAISLDGISEYHDSQRRFQNGKGSFALVERSLDRLARHNFKPSITVTVSQRNADGLPLVVEYLLERRLQFTINFYRENEHSASFYDLTYQDEQMINAMQKAFVKIENKLPPFSILGAITDRARLDSPHAQPCGVGHSYMVIDQKGNVAKCHMEIERKITDISVADPLRVLQLDKTGIQNHSVEEKEGCRACEWRYYCAGGCPALTYRVTGRYDVKSPNCRIYKALFPEVLRLEGLRLIKYAKNQDAVLH